MTKYHLTNKAVIYSADIGDYTYHTWLEKQVEKYYLLLLHSFQELTKTQYLGNKIQRNT